MSVEVTKAEIVLAQAELKKAAAKLEASSKANEEKRDHALQRVAHWQAQADEAARLIAKHKEGFGKKEAQLTEKIASLEAKLKGPMSAAS